MGRRTRLTKAAALRVAADVFYKLAALGPVALPTTFVGVKNPRATQSLQQAASTVSNPTDPKYLSAIQKTQREGVGLLDVHNLKIPTTPLRDLVAGRRLSISQMRELGLA